MSVSWAAHAFEFESQTTGISLSGWPIPVAVVRCGACGARGRQGIGPTGHGWDGLIHSVRHEDGTYEEPGRPRCMGPVLSRVKAGARA